MTLRAVNRHINFATGEIVDQNIGWHACTVDDLDSEMQDSKELFQPGALEATCLNQTDDIYLFGSYRNFKVGSRSHIYISFEKCIDEPHCEKDPAKVEEFFKDI